MALISVFLSQYRRHPGQLLGLLSILACAGALWSGIQSLTGRASSALALSNAALQTYFEVEREDGRALQVSDFARLRRSGVCVTPRLLVPLTEQLSVLGIDPLTADCLRMPKPQTQVVEQLLAAPTQVALWGTADSLRLWRALPRAASAAYPLAEMETLPRGVLLTDIADAARLDSNGVGRLALLLPTSAALPSGYRSALVDYGVDPGSLVDSFLFSLDALGWLALLVAALLLRSVYLLELEQRRRTMRLLHRLGVEQWRLRLSLLIEALLLALLGGAVGLWLGQWLARSLAEGIGSTLASLFSLNALGEAGPMLQIWVELALVLLLLIGWAGVDLVRSGPGEEIGRRAAWTGSWYPAWIGAALAIVGGAGLLMTDQLQLLFAMTGLCLLGAGLLVPAGVGWGLAWLQHLSKGVLLEWSCSEMAALCRLLRLPLLALTLAIASAIGVQAMVSGFETTFTRWLEQRLQGDLYLDPGRQVSASLWRERLTQLAGVAEVLPMTRGQVLVDGRPNDLLAVDPGSPLLAGWRFLQAENNPWDSLRGSGVLINEQLARRQRIGLGQWLDITLGDKRVRRRVQGVYADYGRPAGEVVLPLEVLPQAVPEQYTTFVLGLKAGVAPGSGVPAQPWLEGSRWQQRALLLQRAQAVFARTFQLTRTLNLLTLVLAAAVLALMGFRLFRLRQPHYTLLYVAGIEKRALRWRLVTHALVLTLLLALLATPLGVGLGWVLVAKVNPAAFGWTLPLGLYPGYWLQVWLICALIGALVGAAVGDPVRLETLKNE
ncbi:ABC transporter permease [Marinobacterium sp. D7]|uniref:FtsX-like permease family protein n=1 Tax=Marinobacterium ramblicola TaxID=2849041 RepID=UPI001C2D6E5C|nr:FtsX-like permease family protein [Marinobacterium ramblicola]MBV1787270.1 ABC transporter permease [Marinobacterium ramblicola]